jgi:hypothetical protein
MNNKNQLKNFLDHSISPVKESEGGWPGEIREDSSSSGFNLAAACLEEAPAYE